MLFIFLSTLVLSISTKRQVYSSLTLPLIYMCICLFFHHFVSVRPSGADILFPSYLMTNASACSPSGFYITLNSTSCILPPIWDLPGPKSGDTVSAARALRQYQPICPCPQAVVPILNCLAINDHAEGRGEMRLRRALISTSNSDRPAGVKLFLSSAPSLLFKSFCLLSVAPTAHSNHAAPSPIAHAHTHNHTLLQTREQCRVCSGSYNHKDKQHGFIISHPVPLLFSTYSKFHITNTSLCF